MSLFNKHFISIVLFLFISQVIYAQNAGEWGKELGRTMNKGVQKLIRIPGDGYPNLQLNVLWSLYMGEMISLQTDLGGVGGYYMQGAIGRNFFLKNPDRELSWMAELGWYVAVDVHIWKLGVMIGRDQKHGSDINMQAILKYCYYLDCFPWIGFSVAVSGGAYFDHGFTWDLRLGVSYRFLADWQY